MGFRGVNLLLLGVAPVRPLVVRLYAVERSTRSPVSRAPSYHATIIAYGQTGSGKTYTMEGSGDASAGDAAGAGDDESLGAGAGVNARALSELFRLKREREIGLPSGASIDVELRMVEVRFGRCARRRRCARAGGAGWAQRVARRGRVEGLDPPVGRRSRRALVQTALG